MLERLSALVDSEDERVAIRAVVEILDRLFGRPMQRLAGDEIGEPIEVRLALYSKKGEPDRRRGRPTELPAHMLSAFRALATGVPARRVDPSASR